MPSSIDVSLIIPTRNRRATLAETLRRLRTLATPRCEVIVVDNDSTDDTKHLQPAFPDVRWILLNENHAAAARNVAAAAASAPLLLMLDDDSWPEPGTIERAVQLFAARSELGAAACRVRLADSDRHDAGGVPGVFFNCGALIRREAFQAGGGYPADYEYYVEEYALACRMWQQGWVIEPRGDLPVRHARTLKNRDNSQMLRRLVRNNLWLWNRFAPEERRADLCASTRERYARVAIKENAWIGYEQGLVEAEASGGLGRKRSPLTEAQFCGLYGLDRARRTLMDWRARHAIRHVAVWSRGKGCEQVLELLDETGVEIQAVLDANPEAPEWRGARLLPLQQIESLQVEGVVIGSLSPGVAEDLAAEVSMRQGGVSCISLAPWLGAGPSFVEPANGRSKQAMGLHHK